MRLGRHCRFIVFPAVGNGACARRALFAQTPLNLGHTGSENHDLAENRRNLLAIADFG
jgi:hypothetical protein